MLEKVRQTIEKYHMLEHGDRVLVGVSGGADSVCLLLVLLELQKVYGLSIEAVHVEHGIRGEESKADAAFVRLLCETKGVAYKEYAVDAIAEAKHRGTTLEETARELRYAWFAREAGKWNATKIAIAHHREDNVETVLLHMSRGTGLRGLCGIPPVRDAIIRPLIDVSRNEIEAYLHERGQSYRTDGTNQDISYQRNYIRHEVIPVMNRINDGVEEHIHSMTKIMEDALVYIREQGCEAAQNCVREADGKVVICADTYGQLPKIIQAEVLRHAMMLCVTSCKDVEQIHYQMIDELFAKQCGRSVNLPYGLRAVREYEGISIRKATAFTEEAAEFSFSKKEIEENNGQVLRKGNLCVRLLTGQGFLEEIPENKYTKWFDYDKIKDSVEVRTRHEGDYFVCDCTGNTQKIKKYFINEKIPADKRDRISLIAEGNHVIWVVGYRISNYYKVNADTTTVLEMTVCEGESDERDSACIDCGE